MAPNLSYYAPSSAYLFLSSTQSVLSPSHVSALLDTYSFDFTSHSLAYKPITKKVRPVLAPLEEEYRVLRRLPDDPLAGFITLLTNPLDFVPGQRFTQECANALDLNLAQWLWPEEVKLVQWMVLNHETAFAWTATEHGRLDNRYFPPVKICTYRPPYTMDTPKHFYPTFVLGSSHTDYQRPYHPWCVRTVHHGILVTLVLRAQTGR